VYVNVSVSRFSIPDCPISKVFFLCISMSVSLDCRHWHTQEKDVRDVTIRNGQSRETDIHIHNKKMLEIGQSGVSVSKLPIPDCHISNVFFLCMSMSVSLDFPFLIVPSLRSFSCVFQCLEIVQSCLENLQKLTLTYKRKRR
jgi:hypothetical protein